MVANEIDFKINSFIFTLHYLLAIDSFPIEAYLLQAFMYLTSVYGSIFK